MDTHTRVNNNSLFYGGNRMTLKDRSWHEKGLCSGHPTPDIWHYDNSIFHDEQQLQVLNSAEAIQICNICPVKAQCLAQGLEPENMQYTGGAGSIWGGLLMSERHMLSTKKPSNRKLISEVRHRRDVRQTLAKISK